MNHIFITHDYNGDPFTFTKHLGYWYVSSRQLDKCLAVQTSEILKNDTATLLTRSIADLYNIEQERVIMPSLSDNPNLGTLIIKDLAMQIVKDIKPKLRVWLIDRISELTFYKIPLENIPDSKLERRVIYDTLIQRSIKEGSDSLMKDLFMNCANAWDF